MGSCGKASIVLRAFCAVALCCGMEACSPKGSRGVSGVAPTPERATKASNETQAPKPALNIGDVEARLRLDVTLADASKTPNVKTDELVNARGQQCLVRGRPCAETTRHLRLRRNGNRSR